MPENVKSSEILTKTDPRWQAVVRKDRSCDETFVYCVKTTGIYCRPSCAARLANPENVVFYESYADAERAGFRACKRCKPDQLSVQKQYVAKIAEICRTLEEAEEIPSLDDLAEAARLSPSHFHRLFKAITGVTPKAYAKAHRTQRVQAELTHGGARVTDAIYAAGFNSSGRFYEGSNGMLGMVPTKYRAGGSDADIHFAIGECSLGAILVARSQRGVCAILIGDDPEFLLRNLQDRFHKARLIGGDPGFEHLIAKVIGHIEEPCLSLDLPLDVRGTAFQQRVWQALRDIPLGTTTTYSEIARRIGAPKAVRAVAGACAANPIAIAIPCHRVVRTDGSLSGYYWGVERKRALLDREKAR